MRRTGPGTKPHSCISFFYYTRGVKGFELFGLEGRASLKRVPEFTEKVTSQAVRPECTIEFVV